MPSWSSPKSWITGYKVLAADMNAYISDNTAVLKTSVTDSGALNFVAATELTIASGVITVTGNYHRVDTESDAASDDLDTITAGTDVSEGFILHLRVESAARTVVLKTGTSGADNLDIGDTDITLDESFKTYSLVLDSDGNWRPFSFSASPTFASISPLTTRGDVLYGSSGTVTGTRLALGSTTRVLQSDGTDVAWSPSYKDVGITLAGVSNTTAKTAFFTLEEFPGDFWGIGDVIEVDLAVAVVNVSGSTRTVTFELGYGGGSVTQTKDWETSVAVRYMYPRWTFIRRVSTGVVWPFAGPYSKAGLNPGDGSDLMMTVADFSVASQLTMSLTFPVAHGSLYISPQAGQARIYKS